jgi:hypothetical protein
MPRLARVELLDRPKRRLVLTLTNALALPEEVAVQSDPYPVLF